MKTLLLSAFLLVAAASSVPLATADGCLATIHGLCVNDPCSGVDPVTCVDPWACQGAIWCMPPPNCLHAPLCPPPP